MAATTLQRRHGLLAALVLAVLGVVVAGVVVVTGDDDPVEPAAPAEAPGPTYRNPVLPGEVRNPAVLVAADGTYWAYADGLAPDTVHAYRSDDLAWWRRVDDVRVDTGAWAPPGRLFTPAVRHVPGAPADARYVMYVAGPGPDPAAPSCVVVATAADPAGPFVGADAPLACPPGGAWAPSPAGDLDQIVFRAEQPTPGVYGLALDPTGAAVAPGAQPVLLLGVEQGILRHGVLDRPAVARHGEQAYLFVGTGDQADGGVGWSPCLIRDDRLETCAHRRALGTWLEGGRAEGAPHIGGLQTFTDADGAWWVTYGAGGGMNLDKLCFAHDVPRTNGPSTGPQTVDRRAACEADVPGAPLAVAAVDDGEVIDQPPDVAHREVAATAPLAGRLLWLFGDTYIDPTEAGRDGCDQQGASRSGTAGLGLPHPLAGQRGYSSPLAAFGDRGTCTGQYLPLTGNETFFTMAQSAVGRRVALWVDGSVPLDDGSALVFFTLAVHDRDSDDDGPDPGCPFCYDYRGQGVVRVQAGEPVADRASTAVGCLPRCLFGPEDVGWRGRPFVADGHLYAYTDTPETETDVVRLGRVPLAQATDRSAWTFRTTEGEWSADIGDAAEVAGLEKAPTVAYNGYLDRFVAVVGTVDDDVVSIQTAPAPWGPWGDPVAVDDWSDTECEGKDLDSKGAQVVPGLDDAGGRVMRFAYTRPGPDFGRDPACPGQVRLVTVELE